ncbi:hypothetical protein OG226_11695 [Streptomyces sp. NBC_01261]|uniref:hypothetical protein n=1 Tax=unclassified Streptomyces TaxID=2593676 RepID=UPI002E2D1F19|nr:MULTISPECIES: hypothetical protein [unclassified Streptomyces]
MEVNARTAELAHERDGMGAASGGPERLPPAQEGNVPRRQIDERAERRRADTG